MYEYVVILVVIGSNLKVFIHSILQTKNSKQIQIDRYRCFLCACVFFFVCVLCHFWKKYSAQLNWKDNIVIKFESHVKSNWIVFSLSLLMLDIRRLSLLCQFSHQYIAFERSVSRFHASYLASWPKNLQQISKLTCISAM